MIRWLDIWAKIVIEQAEEIVKEGKELGEKDDGRRKS